ncbi:MAG: hypothetical protein ACREC3_04380 [Methyloceanibacter sp.]
MKTLNGVIVFTVVEWVILVAWGALLELGAGLSAGTQILAAGVLLVGLFVEHLVSVNVGRGRPFFEIPRD